jgi:hypothetical protein
VEYGVVGLVEVLLSASAPLAPVHPLFSVLCTRQMFVRSWVL